MLELVATKLSRPPARPVLVDRARLLAQLEAAPGPAVVVVVAPAGFGKSTLVGALAARQEAVGRHVAWLSLDEDDSEPARLLLGLIAAVRAQFAAVGETALALLQTPQPGPRAVLGALINDLAARATPLTLVLDDYHLVAGQASHEAVTFLLDRLPPSVQVVITARADPPLPLARWRARGTLVELRADDLRFTAAEAAAFFAEVMRLELTPAQVTALEARTEGWAAGLQLAALSLRGRADPDAFIAAFTGSHRFVLDYLAAEVLDGLPAHLRDFLVRTAILERLCGALCDAVLGAGGPGPAAPRPPGPGAYSDLILAELERRNLFLIPLDDDRCWYRYHHLFADVLRARLLSGAGETVARSLHSHASAWHEAYGDVEEALRHALAAGEAQRAADLIARSAGTWLTAGQIMRPARWVEALPVAVVRARPDLAALAGWSYTTTGVLERARHFSLVARAALTPDTGPEVRGLVVGLEAQLAQVQRDPGGERLAEEALALLGDSNPLFSSVLLVILAGFQQRHLHTDAAVATLSEALALSVRLGQPFLLLVTRLNLCGLLVYAGRLRDAVAVIQPLASSGAVNPFTEMAQYGLARVHYERDELELAEERAVVGLRSTRRVEWANPLPSVLLLLAQVRLDRGDIAGALATIEEALADPIAGQSRFVAAFHALAANARLVAGDRAAAQRWAGEVGAQAIEPGDLQRGAELCVYCRLLLAEGRAPEAAALLEPASAVAATSGARLLQITFLALLALARAALDEHSAALARLGEALAIAAPEGFRRVFLGQGPPMAPLLARFVAAAPPGPQRAFAQELLEALQGAAGGARNVELEQPAGESSGPAPRPLPSAPGLPEPLSERELEVLRLVAAGASNSEIAEQLIVAIGTVKRHINNIFGKLGAERRSQAVARARDLGLL